MSPDTGVASEQIRDWSAALSHFLSTYRWELWLVVGIPAIGLILTSAAFFQELVLADSHLRRLPLSFAAGSFASLLLLAVSYLRVRDLGREFLTLLWGYLIVSSALRTVLEGTLYFSVGHIFGNYDTLAIQPLSLLFLLFVYVLGFLVLLWFARQASRISLSHAFFLVVFTTFAISGEAVGTPFDSPAGIAQTLLVSNATAFAVLFLKVWLLGNFDGRGSEFRRNAIFALVAITIAVGYLRAAIDAFTGNGDGEFSALSPFLDAVSVVYGATGSNVIGLATLLVALALVYLVRVRRPRDEAALVGDGTG